MFAGLYAVFTSIFIWIASLPGRIFSTASDPKPPAYSKIIVEGGFETTANVYDGAWWEIAVPSSIRMKGFQLYSRSKLGDIVTFDWWDNSVQMAGVTAICTELSNEYDSSPTTWMLSSPITLDAGTVYRMIARQFPGGVAGSTGMPVNLNSHGPWPPAGDSPFYPYFVILY